MFDIAALRILLDSMVNYCVLRYFCVRKRLKNKRNIVNIILLSKEFNNSD